MNIKYSQVLIALILCFSALHSESEYFEHSLPTEDDLVLVEFFDSLNGIIVSEDGQIYYTNSMAKKWSNTDIGLKFNPKKMIFSKSGEAIIIGSNSTILKSFNYGKDWIVISHDEESDVVYNSILTRNANEYYLTTEGTTDIYYSYDGLQNIEKINTSNLDRKFRSYPLVYSKSRNALMFLGSEGYSTEDYVEFYYNLGIYKSQNCDNFIRMNAGVNALSEPVLNRYKANELLEIDDQILKVSDYRINFIDGYYYDYIDYSKSYILESQDSIKKVKKTGEKSFVALLSNGEILKYDSVHYKTFGLITLDYNLDTIINDNNNNFDYDNLNDSLSIIVSKNGKYYLNYNKDKIIIPDDDEQNDEEIVVDIDDIKSYNNFFPNPTNDISTLVFGEKIFVRKVQVFSLKGYLLFENSIMKKTDIIKINLKNLQSSSYHIKIIGERKFIYKNIIKF